MARTRSADYENIRDTIIERAAAMFARQGYSETSIGDIARACACSKSRLYHYFDSKEAVLRDMLTTHVDSLLERCRQVLYGSNEPKTRFLQIVKLFLEIYATSRDRHVVMLTCLDALPEDQRKALIAKQRELIAYVRDALLQLRPDMAANRTLAHVDTMLFFGMINWTYTWYKADGSVSPDALAERTVQLFLDGYLNLPSA
ncbi:TetR/AcrR family transcriptional regulator [Bordetella bronchiseptica]|uniref:TetR/AcrR family transcriptional regulator n=1 Tax=Bordetella bronchiseptica TaxID=518 RepID=UPI00045ADD51|nr:TetR/AcrR family transcriptional regulator [Bordetella bronchiseptica]KCV56221.1 transcriptional regulator, TetR family [Bordetella bronchiseptica 7E71]